MTAITQGSTVLALLLGGCSLMWGGIDKGPDGTQLPRCMDTHAPVYVDGLIASLGTAAGVWATRSHQNPGELPIDAAIQITAGAFAVATAFTASALIGARNYNQCRVARAEWHIQDAIAANRADAGTPSAPKQSAARTTARRPTGSPRSPSGPRTSELSQAQRDPRNYFCTSSLARPEVNVCQQGLNACNQARRALAPHDSTDCSPSDTAWCFDIDKSTRCYGTEQACEFHATTTGASGLCTERAGKRR